MDNDTQKNSGTLASLPPQSRKRIKIIITTLVALLIAVAGAFGYYYMQSKKVDTGDAAVKAHVKDLSDTIAAVGKLMYLPEGETPTLATVSDPTKLVGQPFFAHARVGDKVLIYSQVKKAILYNPTDNKIIEVSQVNLSSGNEQTTPPPVTSTTTTSAGSGVRTIKAK